MNELILAGLLGAIGGLTRATIGLLKALAVKRKIIWPYWGLTVVIAVIIGIFTGMVFNMDVRISLLAGYAGTDILEGIYKSFKSQKIVMTASSR